MFQKFWNSKWYRDRLLFWQMKNQIPQKQRYELIQLMNINHVDITSIQNIMGCSRNTVYNAIHYTGRNDELPFHGRPTILKPHHLNYIETRTLGNRTLSNHRLSKEIIRDFDDLSKCSPQTICRARHALGIHFLPMKTNCAVTPSSRTKRIDWCKAKLESQIDWTKVVFSDESWFELTKRKRWIWRHVHDSGPDVTWNKTAHPKKVMIWGLWD